MACPCRRINFSTSLRESEASPFAATSTGGSLIWHCAGSSCKLKNISDYENGKLFSQFRSITSKMSSSKDMDMDISIDRDKSTVGFCKCSDRFCGGSLDNE